MEHALKFLREADTFYVATVEGNQPRVRPFGAAAAFEGRRLLSLSILASCGGIVADTEKAGV